MADKHERCIQCHALVESVALHSNWHVKLKQEMREYEEQIATLTRTVQELEARQ